MNTKLKILFLTPRYPYPLIGGDRIKSYNLLKHLAVHHEVHCVTFSYNGLPSEEHIKALENLGLKLHYIPLSPYRGGMNSLTRILDEYPLEISFFMDKRFYNIVDKLCEKIDFDLGIAFFMRTAEYIKNKSFKKILIAEDCRTIYQQRSYDSSKNIKQRIVRKWEVNKLKHYEPELVNQFDAVTLVSNDDIRLMESLNSKPNYKLVTNGVDLDRLKPNGHFFKRKDILIAGKLNVWANILSIFNITDHVLPLIHKKMPEVKLNIVGAVPPQNVLDLDGGQVSVHADVESLVPFLQNAGVFLHPHLGGSGIQNKLLEAMASGVPVVTTDTGNQGIEGLHGKHLLIGNNWQELANHTIRLLSDLNYASKIAENARKLMEEKHSWDNIYSQIDEAIESVMAVASR